MTAVISKVKTQTVFLIIGILKLGAKEELLL